MAPTAPSRQHGGPFPDLIGVCGLRALLFLALVGGNLKQPLQIRSKEEKRSGYIWVPVLRIFFPLPGISHLIQDSSARERLSLMGILRERERRTEFPSSGT